MALEALLQLLLCLLCCLLVLEVGLDAFLMPSAHPSMADQNVKQHHQHLQQHDCSDQDLSGEHDWPCLLQSPEYTDSTTTTLVMSTTYTLTSSCIMLAYPLVFL